MVYQPSPEQALFIWNLICSHSAEGVPQSQTSPKLSPTAREQLLDAGFLNLEKRGTSGFLTLTEQAWSWAEQTQGVTLASSPVAAEVLEALLRRLVPFLADRKIGLAELLPLRAAAAPRTPEINRKRTTSKKKASPKVRSAPKKQAPPKAKAASRKKAAKKATAPTVTRKVGKRGALVTLGEQIERACLALADGNRKTRVMLSALRRQLRDVDRSQLDHALLDLQDAERLVLYREDNTAALTEEDRRAALTINNEPRHLVMLEGSL